VIELARSGPRVAQLAATFGMSEVTIYNWLKQERIDRGEGSVRRPINSWSWRPQNGESGS
jgi:transposase-like protein